MAEEEKTRGKRREEKRKSKRKMRVVGKSVRTIAEVIKKRFEKLKKSDSK